MDADLRDRFDRTLEQVLNDLPEQLHSLLEEVPLVVDDEAPPDVRREMGARRREELCGLFSGIPLTDRSVEHSGTLPDSMHIYRRGVIASAEDRHGVVNDASLRRQIRITLLHEMGHYFGLEEEQLRRLGYE